MILLGGTGLAGCDTSGCRTGITVCVCCGALCSRVAAAACPPALAAVAVEGPGAALACCMTSVAPSSCQLSPSCSARANSRSATTPSWPSLKASERLYLSYIIRWGCQGMLHVCRYKQHHVRTLPSGLMNTSRHSGCLSDCSARCAASSCSSAWRC
jgi:hypothetical protein